MNFDNWEYRNYELPKDKEANDAALKALEEKFLQEARDNKAVQVWLSRFDESHRQRFLENFAGYKTQMVQFQDRYIKQAERIPELKYRAKTQQVLGMILQKKLFNLQCRWRAEELTLPGVRICKDFWYWAEYIFDCPFLGPVTDADVELMKRYMQTEDFDPEYIDGHSFQWQDYNGIKELMEEDCSNEEVMPWYEFYEPAHY